MARVIANVDSFNLYFGLKNAGFKRLYWLDVAALAGNFLKPGQTLAATHYFTTRIRDNGRNTADRKRQGDYFDDSFDVALVMSGDSDLTMPIRRVRERFPHKWVVLAFPPRRHSAELKRVANGHLVIGEDKLRASQLPDQIAKPDGFVLARPVTWK